MAEIEIADMVLVGVKAFGGLPASGRLELLGLGGLRFWIGLKDWGGARMCLLYAAVMVYRAGAVACCAADCSATPCFNSNSSSEPATQHKREDMGKHTLNRGVGQRSACEDGLPLNLGL